MAILNQQSIAIQIYDRSGKCVAVNRAWEVLFDTRITELETYNVLQDPQVKDIGVYDCFVRAFAGEEIQVPEAFYDPKASGKNGRGRWLKSVFSPVKDEEGVVVEVAILFTDVTELKLAQEEIARSRDHMKKIFDHIPDGIVVQNEKFHIIYANPAAIKIAGLRDNDEWGNKTLFDHFEIMREDGTPLPPEELPSRKLFRGEEAPAEMVMRYRHHVTREERVSLVSARVMFDDVGKPHQAVVVFRDISEKLKIEMQLRDALAAKELFFSVASHELRTPITAMKLNTQLMNLSYPHVSTEVLSKMDRQLNKLSKLVDEMLDISRLSRGRLELNKKEINLSHLTRDVLFGMMDQLKMASMTLSMNISENVTGHWDPDRLEQVVENLVTNAIRYARNRPLHVKVMMENDRVFLEVCDQGPGIPEEDQLRIFNRFEQLRSFGERGGMGLGLYIVKEIITLHGGNISVSNLNTGGARFLIELPRS
ncbi:MAG: PAS domain-containing sensor histidine kinase [Bacteriovoracaceae bacterium]